MEHFFPMNTDSNEISLKKSRKKLQLRKWKSFFIMLSFKKVVGVGSFNFRVRSKGDVLFQRKDFFKILFELKLVNWTVVTIGGVWESDSVSRQEEDRKITPFTIGPIQGKLQMKEKI